MLARTTGFSTLACTSRKNLANPSGRASIQLTLVLSCTKVSMRTVSHPACAERPWRLSVKRQLAKTGESTDAAWLTASSGAATSSHN